jgi:hypothetical protein
MGWKATHVRLRGTHRTVYKGLSECHDKAQGIAERISFSEQAIIVMLTDPAKRCAGV